MKFPDYRPITELSDDEIKEIMQIIYPSMDTDAEDAARLVSITRRPEYDEIDIVCESAWTCYDEDLPDGPETSWAEDSFELDENGIQAIDFALSAEESTLVRQYLLAKGCNYLLKDNPYIAS